ncbi:hypothetical protein ABT186_05170 [Streptomyces sp. NPDC001634]|uniref:hypothetical protein n=1 Tax=Streptomyces sp. NPDC001634 TaxID=3154390 RepID=UPI003318063F
MTSHVEQAVAARIQVAKRRTEDMRRQRAELAAARKAGVARRHASKLYRQASAGDAPVKTYRRHNCSSSHGSWPDLAACVWPMARIDGDGPFAALACRAQAVTLYPVLDQAQGRRRAHDRDGCGPDCRRAHQLIALDPGPEQSGAAA